MYMSRVQVDALSPKVARATWQLGTYHTWVESCFPDDIHHGLRLRHLWRLEQIGQNKYLMVTSRNKPDLTKLEKFGVPGTATTQDYSKYLATLKEGNIYNFKLVGNPVVSAHGKKHPLLAEIDQLNWLLKRAEKHGFEVVRQNDIPCVAVTHLDQPYLKHRGMQGTSLVRATFEGILKIIDLDKFLRTVEYGMGHEKAYGMGMITVIPVRQS